MTNWRNMDWDIVIAVVLVLIVMAVGGYIRT
jgi:hypothetical protein